MTTPGAGPRPLTLRGTSIPPELDEAMIRRVVHGFYDRVRADALLGPVFESRLGSEGWPAHLAKMCDFWSSLLLRTDRYAGRPLPPHLEIGEIADGHFDRWLTLFNETLAAECDPASAELFLDFALRIARSFRMAIAFHRGADSTAIPQLPFEAALAGGA